MPLFRRDRTFRKRTLLAVLILASILFLGFQVIAGGEKEKDEELPWKFPKESSQGETYPLEFPSLTKFTVSLVAVLSAIFLCFLFYKRYLAKTGRSNGGGRRMEVLETIPLGGRKFLHVVRIHGHHLIVGTSPDRVSLLTEIYEARDDEPSGAPLQGEAGRQSFRGFAEGGR